MKTEDELPPALARSAVWTALLILLFLLFNLKAKPISDLVIALPFFAVLYFFVFSIGKEAVSARLNRWIGSDVRRGMAFPALLNVLYFGYVLLNRQNPFQGTLFLVPYLVFFPGLVFAALGREIRKIDWLDFAVFILFLLPTTLIEVRPFGNLPFHGNGFDSVYRIVIILTAVYAFATVRGLPGVGFFPVLNWRHLWTAIWVWLLFFGFVAIVGYYLHFVKVVGHAAASTDLIRAIAFALISSFLHTALFEELFFRGLLQNLLAQRIGQSPTWQGFWQWGLGILLLLSMLVGYSLNGGLKWFPALITLLLFAAAYLVEKSGRSRMGSYTALAITSALFGLVHFHAGSIVFVGMASLGGWAYGYTYLKTGNVFYAALVHGLVGTSALIFGLELVK